MAKKKDVVVSSNVIKSFTPGQHTIKFEEMSDLWVQDLPHRVVGNFFEGGDEFVVIEVFESKVEPTETEESDENSGSV